MDVHGSSNMMHLEVPGPAPRDRTLPRISFGPEVSLPGCSALPRTGFVGEMNPVGALPRNDTRPEMSQHGCAGPALTANSGVRNRHRIRGPPAQNGAFLETEYPVKEEPFSERNSWTSTATPCLRSQLVTSSQATNMADSRLKTQALPMKFASSKEREEDVDDCKI